MPLTTGVVVARDGPAEGRFDMVFRNYRKFGADSSITYFGADSSITYQK
jgi:hypothetical protein